jgi:hypothetical protein
VGHIAKVLRVWKGDIRDTVQFVQFPGNRPADRITEPYAVGQEFILFLWADFKDGTLHVAGAFAVEDGRIHSSADPKLHGKTGEGPHCRDAATCSQLELVATAATPRVVMTTRPKTLVVATLWRRDDDGEGTLCTVEG